MMGSLQLVFFNYNLNHKSSTVQTLLSTAMSNKHYHKVRTKQLIIKTKHKKLLGSLGTKAT